jgi:hypothetical protein
VIIENRDTFPWAEEHRIGRRNQTPEAYLAQAYLTKTDIKVAEELSKAVGVPISRDAVTKKRQGLGLVKTRSGVPLVFKQDRTRYNDPPRFRADNVLVMADVHAPFHDAVFCSELVALARALGIDTVLLAGDFLDFVTISSFTPAMLAEDDPDIALLVSDEIAEAAEFADVLLDNFKSVEMILGNHEERLTRRLAVKTRVTLLRQLLGFRKEERFHISPYYYALIQDNSGHTWRVTHPKNYSIIPVRVACRLADKYQQNIIAAHGHDWGESISTSGRYAAACGMCADPELIEYSSLRDNVRPFMQTGAWMLYQGQPYLLHPTARNPVKIKASIV